MTKELLNIATDETNPTQKNNEWGYVTSLTATCLATDFMLPVIAAKWEGKLSSRHDFWQIAKEHLSGEIIGDGLAIPVSVALHHYMPQVTNVLGKCLGLLMQPVVEKASFAETEQWAKQNNISPDSEQFKQVRTDKYESEMNNMALQATWLVASPILNVTAQKLLFKKDETILAATGAILFNNAVTFAAHNLGRYVAPITSNHIDSFIEDKIFLPLTSIFSGKNHATIQHEKLATEVGYLRQ